jgi:seryl-tRNA synthetase
MGTHTMSDETKAKIAATRAAKKSIGEPAEKRASLDDQIAAAQAQADAGDATATQLMAVIDVLRAEMERGKQASKSAAKKLRRTLSILK